MSDLLSSFRERFGSVFVSILPDDTTVPWRLLTIKECLELVLTSGRDLYTEDQLKLEVYNKCVLTDPDKFNFCHQKAGTPITVADDIIETSYPTNPQQIQFLLDISRQKINTLIYDWLILITQAFPSYSPGDILEMNIEDFMLNVALAERKLLTLGLLAAPLSVEYQKDDEEDKSKMNRVLESQQKVDLSQTHSKKTEQKKEILSDSKIQEIGAALTNSFFDPSEVSPPPIRQDHNDFIVSKSDIMEHISVFGQSAIAASDKMIEETLQFYPEYVEQMKKNEDVRILSPEERKQKALLRQEKNKRIALQLLKDKQSTDQEINDRIKAKIEKKLKKRRHR